MASRMFQSVRELIGLAVRAVDGEAGHVDDVYFDETRWQVRYLVVDTGEWLAGRRVLVSTAAVDDSRPAEALPVRVTRAQIEGSPQVDLHAPVSAWDLEAMHAYYQWPWYAGEALMARASAGVPAPDDRQDLSLRSAREMLRFTVEARDGEVGHIDDFLLGADWRIAYLVIDTGSWLPGRKVALAPTWVDDIRLSESTAYLDLKRETVEASPEYHPAEFLGHQA